MILFSKMNLLECKVYFSVKMIVCLMILYMVLIFFEYDLRIYAEANKLSSLEPTYSLSNGDRSYVSNSVEMDSVQSSAVFGQDGSSEGVVSEIGSKSLSSGPLKSSLGIGSQTDTDASREVFSDGASLFLGDSTVLLEEVSQDDTERSLSNLKSSGSEGVNEYGYNIVSDAPVDARTSLDSSPDLEYSDPALLESLNLSSRAIPEESSLNYTTGNSISKLKKSYDLMKKAEETLFEPSTIKSGLFSKSLKTPDTQSIEDTRLLEDSSVIKDEKVPVTSAIFTPNEDGIQISVKSIDPVKRSNFIDLKNMVDNSKSTVSSESIFEDMSESKLPKFILDDNERKVLSPPKMISSEITSDISELSESKTKNHDDNYKSELLEISVPSKEETSEVEESLFKDVSNTYSKIDSSQSSLPILNKSVEDQGNTSESTFENPPTEDITIESSSENVVNEPFVFQDLNNDPSKSLSASVEPPLPPVSAVEENTVGNQRIYSGPYIRTNATSGKVSPRIASVIKSLAEQFEKYNIYGAGDRNNISNQHVNTIKHNFEVKNDGDFIPQNSLEEQWLNNIKNQKPNNTFLYNNRYEEMKATQNTFGKSLLQEELEKMRGTYKSSLSKQFGTGKIWERPDIQSNRKIENFSYSNNSFSKFNDKGQSDNNRVIYKYESQPVENEVENEDFKYDQFYTNEKPIDNKTIQLSNNTSIELLSSSVNTDENSEEESFVPSTRELNSIKSDSTIDTSKDSTEFETSNVEMRSSENTSDKEQIQNSNFTLQKISNEVESDLIESEKESTPNLQKNQILENTDNNYYSNKFGNLPFSYINNVKRLSPNVTLKELNKSPINDSYSEQNDNDQVNSDNSFKGDDMSFTYSKYVELSPEQENEILKCYSKAKRIKTINFGLDIYENPQSTATQALINELTEYKHKSREIIKFAREVLRIAEKYNKKKSWRKKTKHFKLEFLELANEFFKHSKAIKSLVHHLNQVTNSNIMEILYNILSKHKHSKQSLLMQCKTLYQAFYSYKNSIRSKLISKISNLYFPDVLNNQIEIFIAEKFLPISKLIISNKYLKRKLGNSISVMNQLFNIQSLDSIDKNRELSKKGNRKDNKFMKILKSIFKKPSFKSSKNKKESKKSKNISKSSD